MPRRTVNPVDLVQARRETVKSTLGVFRWCSISGNLVAALMLVNLYVSLGPNERLMRAIILRDLVEDRERELSQREASLMTRIRLAKTYANQEAPPPIELELFAKDKVAFLRGKNTLHELTLPSATVPFIDATIPWNDAWLILEGLVLALLMPAWLSLRRVRHAVTAMTSGERREARIYLQVYARDRLLALAEHATLLAPAVAALTVSAIGVSQLVAAPTAFNRALLPVSIAMVALGLMSTAIGLLGATETRRIRSILRRTPQHAGASGAASAKG